MLLIWNHHRHTGLLIRIPELTDNHLNDFGPVVEFFSAYDCLIHGVRSFVDMGTDVKRTTITR